MEKTTQRRLIWFAVLIFVYTSTLVTALPPPAKQWCSDKDIPFEKCSIDGGTRMMEEVDHIPVPMPHWWETLEPYTQQCPTCTPIWLLCPSDDTGAWDGGSALRLGSRIMLEKINEQQWLLPGYELMCEYYNMNCHAKTAQKIVQGRTSLYANKFVGVGNTGCSGVSNTLSSYTWTYNMPIISWASGAPDLSVRTTHRNFFRTVIPHTAFTFAWISVYLISGWKDIVVIMAEEARFRGHFEMHKTETRKAGLNVAFEAQILQPLQQTDGIFTTIKKQRYRIIQAVTFENSWRAMMCSAYSLGMRDLIWLVFGVYSKGWYITLDNPKLTQWNCGKAEMKMMANNAIYAMTVMWSQTMDVPLYCDRDRIWTPQSYKDLFIERMNAELKDPKTVSDRGGHAPKLGYGPAPADGICLYAQTIATLLGIHPEGKKAPNGKTYTLADLTGRSNELYDQFNTILQGSSFNGVGNSPLSFYCNALPADNKCGASCRNSAECTGDLNGPTEIYQFDKDGEEGNHDSYAAGSMFPMRQIYDRSIEAAATTDAEKAKAYTWFSPFRYGYGKYWGGEKGKFNTTAPMGKNGETCVLGYHVVPGTTMCVPDDLVPDVQQDACKMHTYFDKELKVCFSCPSGKMQMMNGQTECNRCPKGYFSNATVQECAPCALGTFADSEGLDVCSPCGLGAFNEEMGQMLCKRCDVGTYSAEDGSTGCKSCAGDLTTQFLGAIIDTDCECGKESYRDAADRQKCLPCTEGLSCKFGADQANFGSNNGTIPELLPNYYTEAAKPLFVYLCLKEGACPGGPPQQCDGGRTGLVCSLCPDDMVFAEGLCEECKGGDNFLLFLIFAVFVVALLGVYQMANDKIIADVSYALGLSVAGGMVVTVFQLLGSFNSLPIPWPSEVKNLLEASTFLVFDPDSVAAECIFGAAPPTQYFLRVIVPYLTVASFLCLFVITKIVFPCCGKPKGCFDGKFAPWTWDKTLNTIGQVLQTLFIAFAAIAATALQCYSHPNGDQSIVTYPQVLCGTGDHTPLILLSVTLILTFVAPFLVVTVWANWHAPAQSVGLQSTHLIRFRFLVYRFRPNVWWWGTIVAVRQLLLAFSPMVQPDDPYAQIMYVVTVLVLYVCAASYTWPWKSHELNIVESGAVICLALFVVTAGAYVPATERSSDYAVVMLALLVIIFAILGVAISFAALGTLLKGRNQTFGKQYKATSSQRLALGKQWRELCCTCAALDDQHIAHVLAFMSSFDRTDLDRVMNSFYSINTRVMSATYERGLSRIANVRTTTAENSDDSVHEVWNAVATIDTQQAQDPAYRKDVPPPPSGPSKAHADALRKAHNDIAELTDWTASDEGPKWAMDSCLSLHLAGTTNITSPRFNAHNSGLSPRSYPVGITTPRSPFGTPPHSPRSVTPPGTPRSDAGNAAVNQSQIAVSPRSPRMPR